MGMLVDGRWTDEDEAKTKTDKSGRFNRAESVFRNWVSADGAAGPSGEGGFAAAPGRYHLYIAMNCPWAHRTALMRKLKKLDDVISLDHVLPRRDERGWTLLDHLLVAALNRAFTFEQMHGVAVRIGEHLYLDVARALDGLLQVEPVVTKRAARFPGGACGRGSQLRSLTHEAQPLAATSRGGFEHHREADARRLGGEGRGVGNGLEGARDDRHAGGDGDAARGGLLAHLLDHVGWRADEANLGGVAGTREVGVL